MITRDCVLRLSNVERLNIWTVTRTILEKNPGIKSGQLWKKVGEKTGFGRSTIYDDFSSFELQGKLYREKGKCFLPEQYEEYEKSKRSPKKRHLSKADYEIALKHSKKS